MTAANMDDYAGRIDAAAAAIAQASRLRPRVTIILGSGLGDVADALTDARTFDYAQIPHFPRVGVDGHSGRLLMGKLRGVNAAVFAGRAHFYEGNTMRDVALPLYVAHRLGATTLVVTNAAGGVNPQFEPGDVMLVTDHINLAGGNPLAGEALLFGPRFVDMRDAYDVDLRATAKIVARSRGVELREGVYAMLAGPAYETGAEVRMLRTLGVDAVGMSTVPEVIAARHAGMRVVGFSVIANKAADDAAPPLTHADVLRAVGSAAAKMAKLIEGVVETLKA